MAAEGPEEVAAPAAAFQVVKFRLGRKAFALDVDDVDIIVDLESFTRVPRAPAGVDGVMDLRGDIVAIVDPRVHFSVDADHEDEQEVLVLDRPEESQSVGLRVDEVIGVESIPERDVDFADEMDGVESPVVDRGLVRGVVREGGGPELVSWIDAGGLLAETRDDGSLTAGAGGAP